ncbi:MAG: hypothetical protein HON32_06555 [Francisellaceae bacterium]|jgi:hypothetical protein|nr:hypothetical protein [Francisellaceae bacterium]MBT6539522.1 hypothetical protein [Francisellaceae bacterium]
MTESHKLVVYYIAQQAKTNQLIGDNNIHSIFNNRMVNIVSESQKQAVDSYLNQQEPRPEIIDTFIEVPENRRTTKWPQLERAVDAAKLSGALLVIAELGTLTNNEYFAQLLLESSVNFYCCDQPFVNHTILEALYKHAQVQRKLHGKLIREGLKMTSAKSGNPNAAEVISKVNKPKIDTAIVFAFLLQPIISDYRRKGYSQRQMVKALNEEGFTAPEGGKWVLSQLQKVLDRVKLNEIALQAGHVFSELSEKQYSYSQIAEEFRNQNIISLKRTPWDEAQVKKLEDRIKQIQEITHINQLVLSLLPIVKEFRTRNLTIQEMLDIFEEKNITIKEHVA